MALSGHALQPCGTTDTATRLRQVQEISGDPFRSEGQQLSFSHGARGDRGQYRKLLNPPLVLNPQFSRAPIKKPSRKQGFLNQIPKHVRKPGHPVIMDRRAVFRIDMGLYTRSVSWPLLNLLCGIRVRLACQKRGP